MREADNEGDEGDEGAGSSKLMKLKFAESFLSTEITEMPIDPGKTLLFHGGGEGRGGGGGTAVGRKGRNGDKGEGLRGRERD